MSEFERLYQNRVQSATKAVFANPVIGYRSGNLSAFYHQYLKCARHQGGLEPCVVAFPNSPAGR